MNAPAIVSGDGSAPSVSAGMRRIADADLEERRRERGLDLVEVEVELVRPDADEPDVEDEVGVGALRERLDEGRLAGDGRGVELEPCSNGVLPTCRSSTVTVRAPAVVVELDEEHLAGPVLVEGDRLGRAGVGVGDAARLGLLGRVPVAEREVVEAARGDLVGRDHDLVASVLPGIAIDAVDHARCASVAVGPSTPARRGPASGLCGARLVAKTGPWTTTSQRRQVDRRVVRRRGP